MNHPERERIIEEIGRCLSGVEDLLLGYVYGSFLVQSDFHDIDIGLLISGEREPYELSCTGDRCKRSHEHPLRSVPTPRVRFLSSGSPGTLDREGNRQGVGTGEGVSPSPHAASPG